MSQTRKKNKSSIIRVIISNFDDKEIKEIKVLYTKQGGVDTIKLKKGEPGEGNSIIFELEDSTHSTDEKCQNRMDQSLAENIIKKVSEDKKVIEVTKKDTYTGKIIRKYILWGDYKQVKDGKISVKIYVKDILDDKSHLQQIGQLKRRSESFTERVLLSEEIKDNYSQISGKSIDSKEIYKIKRFFSYRSNMLIYFNFINDFLVAGTGKGEIWEHVYNLSVDANKKVLLEKIERNFQNYIHTFIENHNNWAEKYNQQIEDKKHKYKMKIEKIDIIDSKKIQRDIEKIIYIFSDLRHKIMHYEYKFFEKLFTGEDVDIKIDEERQEKLSQMLDLNLFKELSKINNIQEGQKTNFLEDDTEIILLRKRRKAKKYYNLYHKICNRKNGFNNFINSLFTIDGLEDQEFKKLINEHFEKQIEYMEKKISDKDKGNRKTEKVLKEMKRIKELIGEPYIWDIHTSPEYKELYKRRNNLVQQQAKLIEAERNEYNKIAIKDINQQLLELKSQMEEITRLNSKFRLQYKLQVAYGFLFKEFNINIKDFGNKFEPSHTENIKNYKKQRQKYLYAYIDSKTNNLFKLDLLEHQVEQLRKKEEDFLAANTSNNLVKLYILMYLLIPSEIRGDFLGFVKKNYYDMKHVDFISEDIENKDSFFHKLRLFEKNIKKLEIISYEVEKYNNLDNNGTTSASSKTETRDFDEVYKALKIDSSKIRVVQKVGEKEKRMFDKNIILPMMKYYQMAFKLFNDIEIHALFKFKKMKKLHTLEEAIKKMQEYDKKGHLNFKELMSKINEGEKHKSSSNKKEPGEGLVSIRNCIAHLNYVELFINPFTVERKEKMMSHKIHRLIAYAQEHNLEKIELGMDFINDYYMKKEQFLYNMKMTKEEIIKSTAKKKKKEKEQKLLKQYALDQEVTDSNLQNIFRRYSELMKVINNEKDISCILQYVGREEVFLEKNKKKTIQAIIKDKETQYFDKIKAVLQKQSSELLGIYKKYVIRKIKEQLIQLFRDQERRYLKLEIFDKGQGLSKEYTVQIRLNYNNNSNEEQNLKNNERLQIGFTLEKIFGEDGRIFSPKGNSFTLNLSSDASNSLNHKWVKGEIIGATLKLECNADKIKNHIDINILSKYIQRAKFLIP